MLGLKDPLKDEEREPISIQLFADRLEVISPGRFSPGTTVQSYKEGMSKIRNRAIADILHHLTRATRDWLHRLQADDEVAATDHPLNSPQRRWTLPVATKKPRKATRKSS